VGGAEFGFGNQKKKTNKNLQNEPINFQEESGFRMSLSGNKPGYYQTGARY